MGLGDEVHLWTANAIKAFVKRDVSDIRHNDTEDSIYGDACHDLGMTRGYYTS